MGRTGWVLAGGTALHLALLAGTFPTAVGTAWWHHLGSLAGVLALAAVLRRRRNDRAFLAFGVLATSILATASGFYLLYWKEGIRVDGYQDWGVFWHVAWSWAAAAFFWQHAWVNRVAFVHFWHQASRRGLPLLLHAGAYGMVLAGLLWTWGPAKSWFTVESYLPLGFAAWLVSLVCAYAFWLLLRRRPAAHQRAFRGRVDVALVPIAALATLSGLPLLWLDPQLEGWGLKYTSKFWHVWPSVVFAVLVFAHAAQAWANVRAHWRKLRRQGGEPADEAIANPGAGPL